MTKKERKELLTEVLDSVEDWFIDNCGDDGYDSFRDRVRDMQAMADGCNDPMVDNCIAVVGCDFDIDIEKEFYDEIVDKLVELAQDEI